MHKNNKLKRNSTIAGLSFGNTTSGKKNPKVNTPETEMEEMKKILEAMETRLSNQISGIGSKVTHLQTEVQQLKEEN